MALYKTIRKLIIDTAVNPMPIIDEILIDMVPMQPLSGSICAL